MTKKLESSFRNMVLVLTCTVLISGGLLSSLYMVTKDTIEAVKLEKKENAIREVLPPFARLADEEIVTLEGIGDFTVIRAYDASDNFVGAAVESFSRRAYSGDIRIMVGFDAEGKIVDYSVLEQRETPGLGTKIVDWFKTARGNQDIRGRSPSESNFKLDKDGGNIDTITASTISARAFIEAVQSAYAALTNNPDVIDTTSGATAVDTNSGATEIDTNSGATTTE
jgi:electron transport complex protein RnfG